MERVTVSVRVSRHDFAALLVPYLTISNWYYLFFDRILTALKSLETTWLTHWAGGIFNFSIASSVLIGSFFLDKVNKLRIIHMWAAVTPIAMAPFLLVLNPAYTLALLLILGSLFGLGLLAYCVYFCSLTVQEERGRVSGAIVFISLLSYSVLYLLISEFLVTFISCIFLGLSTFIIELFRPGKRPVQAEADEPPMVQNRNRNFLLYLTPWLTYCAINGTLAEIITTHFSRQFAGIMFQITVVQYVTAGLTTVVAGVCADWLGRRWTLIAGVASYGIGTSLSGLASSPQSGIFPILVGGVSGVNWGVFLVVYTLVVWGDLSSTKRRAPLYAAGISPFYFSMGLGHVILALTSELPPPEVTLVSGLLIFLSLIPLASASESLPQETRNRMNRDWFYRRLKKIIKEFEEKSQPTTSPPPKKDRA